LKEAKINLRNTPKGAIKGEKAYYCRYADDWVIGVLGRKTTAEDLKTRVGNFLAQDLKLELSPEKTKITDIKVRYAEFLGFRISRNTRKEKKLRLVERGNIRFKMRVGNTKLKFYIPFDEILLKLQRAGFMKPFVQGSGTIIPTALNKWIFLDHPEILKRYNAIIRGYYNYYKEANNVNKLHHVNFVLKHSCAKTLARKFRLRSRAKVFAKFGPNLTYKHSEGKSFSLQAPKSLPYQGFDGINSKKKGNKLVDFLQPEKWAIRSRSNLFKECSLCGATENIEMHNVRKLCLDRGKKFKDSYSELMSKLQRKQILVCKSCHQEIHKKKDGK
jgi:hypothetical protein